MSPGLIAQSVGGGGGPGAFNVSGALNVSASGGAGASVGLGGTGSSGGTGTTVTSTIIGDVTTTGDQSEGVIVQTMGGGGGAGAFNVAGQVTISPVLAQAAQPWALAVMAVQPVAAVKQPAL